MIAIILFLFKLRRMRIAREIERAEAQHEATLSIFRPMLCEVCLAYVRPEDRGAAPTLCRDHTIPIIKREGFTE